MAYDQHINDWLEVCSVRTFRTYMDKRHADWIADFTCGVLPF